MRRTDLGMRVAVLAVLIFLIGCGASKLEIVQVSDKFSDPQEPYGFLGRNNRLSSKSSHGGTHIDSRGVYLDPYVYRDRTTNKVTSVGFYVSHFSFAPSDGFLPIEEITFLTSAGDRVALKIEARDSDFSVGSWNTITKQYNTTFSEAGICTMTLADLQKLANAGWLEAKITGGKLSQTYDKGEIAGSFITNLRIFYDNQVK